MPRVALLALILAPAAAAAQATALPPEACTRLAAFPLPNATITLAQVVGAGRFAAPAPNGGGGSSGQGLPPFPAVPGRVTAASAGLGLGYNGGRGVPPLDALPAFCRVAATLRPTTASEIRMELWLPLEGWNGRFRGTSPNGLGGSINYRAMGAGLADGFAVASTDTGHQGGDLAWMRVPEEITDFAGRAMHETTVAGKALTGAFYGSAPRYAYMIECGGGSNAALHEVQKYPDDYDGVVVGGHAAHLTRQIFGQLWPWLAVHPDGGAPVLPASKLPVLHAAVLAKCDLLDRVADGVIENPLACSFDPAEIACRGDDGAACLTTREVEAARKVYQGPVNPRTNERIWWPLYPGSELDWDFFVNSAAPIGIATGTLRIVKNDPSWDYRRTPVDFDRDVALADASDVARVNASNPDISAFLRRGGKLILSGGWSNALVPAGAVLDYYLRVEATLGREDTARGVRLYMVPGMSECNGGPGTDTFDLLGAVRRWVEQGEAPQEIPASRVEHGRVVRTRPLCPYPLAAAYRGSGSTDDARSFVCR